MESTQTSTSGNMGEVEISTTDNAPPPGMSSAPAEETATASETDPDNATNTGASYHVIANATDPKSSLSFNGSSLNNGGKGNTGGMTKSVTFHADHYETAPTDTTSTDKPRRGPGGDRLLSDESFRRHKIQEETKKDHIFLPWTKSYRCWWGFSVFMSLMTIFFETYQIAFSPAGLAPHDDAASIIGFFFIIVFITDILINFNLAYYDDQEGDFKLVTCRTMIARRYLRGMFWVDLVGVFPFYIIALEATGEMGQDTDLSRYLSLLRLFRLVRLHRVKQLFDTLQYNTHVSLTALTLTRNFGAALIWTHFAACVMYFIARQYHYDEETTWIGGLVYNQSEFERYITALYWSVVTFTTVGYGDFSPVNPYEQIFGMIYMLFNMVIAAWMIGSMTLLIVKTDEQTSQFRDTLQTLDHYSDIHHFDRRFRKRLRTQAKLYFNNRQVADEEVLSNLPQSVRRKVLRKLYLPSLVHTSLMKGIRQQFIDAFLSNCHVEIFSSGEEILSRGGASNDLFLLVDGKVKVLDPYSEEQDNKMRGNRRDLHRVDDGGEDNKSETDPHYETTSLGESENGDGAGLRFLGPGNFINDICFLTETPNTDTVRTATVCKTLTLSLKDYKMISDDHPGSVGKILSNLLRKVKATADEVGQPDMTLTKRLEVLRAGSVFDLSASRASEQLSDTSERSDGDESMNVHKAVASIQARAAVVACKDVIKMHIDKLKDNHTTRFLFAASRDCTATISLMCDQGFDPNCADYDQRTALMVASMKGNCKAVEKLLEYKANPNAKDMHGTTALYEAAKNGHEDTMKLLLKHGATLGMTENDAASIMCQTVFDGDTVKLRRLLMAGIDANAGDYDQRAAVHIAAAEGNLVAMKVLVEYGADLSVQDRWGRTAMDEAKRVKAHLVMEFLEKQKKAN